MARLESTRILSPGSTPYFPATAQTRPIGGHPPFEIIAKRALDLSVATLLLVALLPSLALVALVIRLDSPGPVFFRQWRTGLDQKSFRIWKFRTMRAEEGPDAPFRQARRRDERVTRVGAVLRRLSIDEIPQLLNVIRGEMSLVGPRPHPLALNRSFETRLRRYADRHLVLPGITGLAQVNGCRGETETLEKMALRLQYDLIYVGRWSLWLDVKILAQTLMGRFLHPNAY